MVVGVVIVYKLVAIIINAVMSSCFYGNKTSFNAGTCYKFNIKDFCLFSSIFLFLVVVVVHIFLSLQICEGYDGLAYLRQKRVLVHMYLHCSAY